MIVASHQPDLLPYSGFWHKMAKADVFEIGIYYQFVDKGYQRRVKMRDKWASVPIIGNPNRVPIKDVRIDGERASKTLADVIRGRYQGARYWKARGDELISLVENTNTDHLWQFNLELLVGVRDMLGIRTPIAIGSPLQGTKSAAIVNSLAQYGKVDTHLSGTGAQAYMGEGEEFAEAGIDLVWSKHEPVTGDSIVSVLFDYGDPLSVVMRERSDSTVA